MAAEPSPKLTPTGTNNPDQTTTLPGHYCLKQTEDGFVISVFPSTGDDQVCNVEDALTELHQQGADTINLDALSSAFKDCNGSPVTIALFPKQPPEINISVSSDMMEAKISIFFPAHSLPLTEAMIVEALENTKVKFGLVDGIVATILQSPKQSHTLAKGIPPVNGTDAKIVYMFNQQNQGRPQEMNNGRVDFKNLNKFVTVEKGQVIAEKIPATAGTPGTNVMGDSVPCKPGKDTVKPPGKNTEYAAGTLQIVASLPGQVIITDGRVTVSPVLDISGDVDFSTGNIDFNGNVMIHGIVQQGFIVKASGDIEVMGTVSGGSLEGKNITVHNGIQGMHKGRIHAADSVTAKFIENSTVFAGNNIVSEAVMHSKIFAGRQIIVEGKRGLIVGGIVSAGELIKTKIIGSNLATPTEIEVGVNPQLREEFNKLTSELKASSYKLDQTKKALAILKEMNPATMSEEKRTLMLTLTKVNYHLLGSVENIRNRLNEINLMLEDMRNGKILVSDYIHPGVKITIGTLIKQIPDTVKFASLCIEDGDIKIGPYK